MLSCEEGRRNGECAFHGVEFCFEVTRLCVLCAAVCCVSSIYELEYSSYTSGVYPVAVEYTYIYYREIC